MTSMLLWMIFYRRNQSSRNCQFRYGKREKTGISLYAFNEIRLSVGAHVREKNSLKRSLKKVGCILINLMLLHKTWINNISK